MSWRFLFQQARSGALCASCWADGVASFCFCVHCKLGGKAFFFPATIRQLRVVLSLDFSGVAAVCKLHPISALLAFALGCNGSRYHVCCFGGLHFLSLGHPTCGGSFGTRDTGLTGGATANMSSSQVALPPHFSSSVSRCHRFLVMCCHLDPSLPLAAQVVATVKRRVSTPPSFSWCPCSICCGWQPNWSFYENGQMIWSFASKCDGVLIKLDRLLGPGHLHHSIHSSSMYVAQLDVILSSGFCAGRGSGLWKVFLPCVLHRGM